MTYTVEDTAAWGRPGEQPDHQPASQAVVEQATGALIFRYSIGSQAAASLMELWAAEAGVPPTAVARAIVLDICQGLPDSGSDPWLVRWMEDRLRQEVALADLRPAPDIRTPEDTTAVREPVVVAVDHSDVSLDAVVEATRRAARLGVPLRVTADRGSVQDSGEAGVAHLAQRVDLAVELARALEPDVEVLRPEEGTSGRG